VSVIKRRKPAGARGAEGASRHRRAALVALVALAGLAAVGWTAAKQIRSPAQIASEAAPPQASPITVPVKRRTLSTKVIVRGTMRFGGRQIIELPSSQLEQAAAGIVTKPPKLRAELGPGDVALEVDDRPVFVLPGGVSMHRDLRRGSRGPDVRQLETVLARMRLRPGRVDGRLDAATQGAVTAFYVTRGYEPFGPTDVQLEQLTTAQADAATARDAHLQAVNAVEQAKKGVTPGDVEQARIDAVTARDTLHTAELGVASAQARLGTAQTLATAAGRAEAIAVADKRREQAVADADVAVKREALLTAVEDERLAVLRQNEVAAEALPSEREAAAAAVRTSREAVVRAQAELNAAIAAADAVRAGTPGALLQVREEAANLARDAQLAAAELRRAKRGVRTARHGAELAKIRARVLSRPQDTRTLRAITDAARAEARRKRAVMNDLAAKSRVQVPADEILFLPDLPVRVDEVKAKRGSTLSGPAFTVTSSRLIVDSSLGVSDVKLVRVGDPVTIEEQDLGFKARGRVAELDTTPGTRKVDPNRFYFSVVPAADAPSVVGASVKLTISVKSTRGKVLAVPVSALSVGGDGSSRLQVRRRGRTELVTVVPGLAADGFVEVRPTRKERLRRGELVIVGERGRAKPPPRGGP
jgi:hypothetical protein